MIELYNKANNDYLGKISEEELQFLIDNLEEENMTDEDYYIDKPTLEFLKERNASSYLVKIIEDTMGDNEFIEILYKRK